MKFEISSNFQDSHFYIRTVKSQLGFKYLHCDGRVIDVCEYFESKEAAQKVLDKYYPEPKHVWEHGDVFRFETSSDFGIMIYIHYYSAKDDPFVCYVNKAYKSYGELDYYLENAKFLFNIKEKL